MSRLPRQAKRDAIEADVIQALEAQGFSVIRLSGTGIPDLLVGKHGADPVGNVVWLMWLVEVKSQKGKLTPAQEQLPKRWRGPAPIVVRSVQDALRFALLAMASGSSALETSEG